MRVALFLLFAISVAHGLRLAHNGVLKPFYDGKALKIISGLRNLNEDNVRNVVIAANNGGASHVDIACDARLVRMAKSLGTASVCVSSISPTAFVESVDAGADLVEIGNFDGFYAEGRRFNAEDVLEMTKETRRLLPSIPLSVTIPHTLSLRDQISLAQRLEAVGADIIQTEGKYSVDPSSMGVQEMIEKAAPSLASAYALSRAVTIPVLCSSGICDVTAVMALAAGAKGVGVGSMVSRLADVQQMTMAVRRVAQAMGREAARPAIAVVTTSQVEVAAPMACMSLL